MIPLSFKFFATTSLKFSLVVQSGALQSKVPFKEVILYSKIVNDKVSSPDTSSLIFTPIAFPL